MVMAILTMPATGAFTPSFLNTHTCLLSFKSALAPPSPPLLKSPSPALSSTNASSRRCRLLLQAGEGSQPQARDGGERLVRRAVVGVLAAAVLAGGGAVMPASGAEGTSERAAELLRSADKLSGEEAPRRFGPGQFPNSVEDAASFSQKAGAGAIEGLQSSGNEVIESAKKNLESTKRRIDGIFGKTQEKAGDISDLAAGKVSETKEKAQGMLGQSLEAPSTGPKHLLGSKFEEDIKDNVVE